MLAGVASDPGVDDARWADTSPLLDRAPTWSASLRLRRWRRLRVLLVVAVLLGTAVVVVAAVVLLGDTASSGEEVPTWQAAVGFVVAGAGLTLQLIALAALWWVARRARVWRSPLAVLTDAQRKDVLAQVRGGRPVDAARVPLARLLAEQMVGQRTELVGSLGLGICLTGLWIASPTAWRAALVCVHGLVLAVVWLFVERDARRALRFLCAHPHR
jgi:hypothetical protein